jgi:hypothetical protein
VALILLAYKLLKEQVLPVNPPTFKLLNAMLES